jgi:hypothetical protein
MTKEQLMAEICSGREDAFEFINLWLKHAHEVDDIIDKKIVNSQLIVQAFVNAYHLFTHPFFLANKDKLYPIHILAAVAYANSNEFADMAELDEMQAKLADNLRSFGNHLLVIVAGICCPENTNVFERMCWLGTMIHKQAWLKHHDENGKPI